jgi:hypothetical protein
LAALQASATLVRANSTIFGRQLSSSTTGRRTPTHMIPLAWLHTQQQGDSSFGFPGNRIGNTMAMMMMNQASDRDEQRHKSKERCREFHLQIEIQHQQMQQQQNMMMILLMKVADMTNCQHQQLRFGNNSTTSNQQQQN